MQEYSKIIEALNSNQIYKLISEELKNEDINVVKDSSDNIIIKKSSPNINSKKILFCALTDMPRMIICKSEKNKHFFETVHKGENSSLCNEEAYIGNNSIGIIRGEYKDEKLNKLYIEVWNDEKISIGDICRIEITAKRKGDILYSNHVSSILSCVIAIYFGKNSKEYVNDIYFTLSDCDNKTIALVNELKPDYIFLLHTSKTETHFKSNNGCGIVYKDGCAVIGRGMIDIMTKIAIENKLAYQPYFGKNTALTEKLGVAGDGAHVGGIYIPAEHFNTSIQTINFSDLHSAENLIEKLSNL